MWRQVALALYHASERLRRRLVNVTVRSVILNNAMSVLLRGAGEGAAVDAVERKSCGALVNLT